MLHSKLNFRVPSCFSNKPFSALPILLLKVSDVLPWSAPVTNSQDGIAACWSGVCRIPAIELLLVPEVPEGVITNGGSPGIVQIIGAPFWLCWQPTFPLIDGTVTLRFCGTGALQEAWPFWNWQVTNEFGLGVDPPVQPSWPFWYPQLTAPFGGNGIPTIELRSGIKPDPLQAIWPLCNPQVTGDGMPFGPVTVQTSWTFWSPQVTFGALGLEGGVVGGVVGGVEGGVGLVGGLGFLPFLVGTHFVGDVSMHGAPFGVCVHCKLNFNGPLSAPSKSLSWSGISLLKVSCVSPPVPFINWQDGLSFRSTLADALVTSCPATSVFIIIMSRARIVNPHFTSVTFLCITSSFRHAIVLVSYLTDLRAFHNPKRSALSLSFSVQDTTFCCQNVSFFSSKNPFYQVSLAKQQGFSTRNALRPLRADRGYALSVPSKDN